MFTTVPGQARLDSLAENWARLREVTTMLVLDKDLSTRESALFADEMSRYMQLLESLRHDRYVGDVCVLGMFRAPASANRHHAVEGGLVQHLLQMRELWLSFKGILRDHNAHHPELNDRNVWKCILHHDLNKVWRYAQVKSDTWSVTYADDVLSKFLGDSTNKTLYFLNQHHITLTPALFNALITAEGGFSTQPRPKVESVLAKVCYLLDDMSANVIDRLQTGRFWDSKVGGINEVP